VDQDNNRVLLGYSLETSTVAYNLLIVCDSLKTEVVELVILDIERFCGSHDVECNVRRTRIVPDDVAKALDVVTAAVYLYTCGLGFCSAICS
jgi:hypothetical protein